MISVPPALAPVRLVFAFGAAVSVAVFATGVVHMQIILADLGALGVGVDPGSRLHATLITVRGFIPTLGPVLAAGFAVGFLVAAGVKRVLKPLAWAAYPSAAATAMAVALLLMKLDYETTPIASARTAAGFLALCAAAALAGWIFARLARPDSGVAAWALQAGGAVIRKAFSLLPSGSRK